MEHLKNDFERATYLQNLLIARATGGAAIDDEFQELRKFFLNNLNTKDLIPTCVRTNRYLDYWSF